MDSQDAGYEQPKPEKVLGLIGLFFASLIAAALPLLSKRADGWRISGKAFFYARHFGTGVILSTAFVHLLSLAFKHLIDTTWFGYKHWPGSIVMASTVAILLVEYASAAYIQHRATHADDYKDEHGLRDSKLARRANGHGSEQTPLLVESNGDESPDPGLLRLKRHERLLSVLILQTGIMLHSFILGLTLSVATAANFAGLLPAMFFHQVFEGITLGIRLANLWESPLLTVEDAHSHNDAVSPTRDRRREQPHESPERTSSPYRPTPSEKWLPPVLVLLFALPIPLILVISLFIPVLETSPERGDSSRSRVMQGITSAISAGMLIYVSLVELIASDFLHNKSMMRSNAKVQVGALSALIVGAVAMSFMD